MTLPSVLQKCQVRIQDSEIIHYKPTDDSTTGSPAVQRAHIFTLRAPSPVTVVLSAEYLELDIPPDLGDDRILALQPRSDTPSQSIRNLATSGLSPKSWKLSNPKAV